MKIIKCIPLALFYFFSCEKMECPQPEKTIVPVVTKPSTTVTNNPDTTTTTTTDTTITNTDTTTFLRVLQPGSEGKDAVLSNIYATQNFGSSIYLHARAWTSNGDLSLEKSILQFDYSAIPAGAIIKKATLMLFADTISNTGSVGHSQLSGPNDWVLKRITQSWDESTVTWNTEPTTDATVLQCPASTSAFQTYSMEITSWVIYEISNPGSYYGFLMQINNNNPYRAIYFCSSDNQDASLHPKLIIEYKNGQ